jgi:poly [ADP-ribose] polymerase
VEILKRELELVQSLGEMEMTQKINVSIIPKDAEGNPINPLDSKLASLALKDISVVDKQSNEFAAIVKYAKDTNAGMEYWVVSNKMTVLEAFRVEREGEADLWDKGGWNGKTSDGERLVRETLASWNSRKLKKDA